MHNSELIKMREFIQGLKDLSCKPESVEALKRAFELYKAGCTARQAALVLNHEKY